MNNSDERARVVAYSGRHLRVSGPPASGKTTLLIERFHQLRERGHRPAIVAYSRAHQARLIEAVVGRGAGAVGEVPVMTYGQLAARGVRGRRLIRDVDELIVLGRLLTGSDAVDLTSDLRSVAGSETLRRDVLAVIHPLLQNGVSAAEARTAGGQDRNARARDLLSVYAAFVEALDSRGLVTHYNAAWGAPASFAERGFTHVLIDDFQDVDRGQFDMIERAAPPDGQVLVEAYGDPTGARFAFRGTSAHFFDNEFPRRYQPDTIHLPAANAHHVVIGPVVSRLLAATGAEVPAPGPASTPHSDLPLFQPGGEEALEVEFVLAEDEVAEAQEVAWRAAALLRDGVAPSDIAVLARDRAAYEAILADAFRGAGVPLDTGRRGRYVIEEFIHALLAIFSPGGGARSEYARLYVIGSPFFVEFRDAFAAQVGLGSRRPERDAQDLDRIVTFVRGGYVNDRTGHFSMKRFVEECVRPFVAGTGARAPVSATLLLEEWTHYVDMVGAIGGRPRLDEFSYLQRFTQGTTRADRDPESVSFFTAREAAALSFAHVMLVGCSEGLFPAGDERASYIPYAAIESSLDGAVTFHRRSLVDEYALLLTALSRASSGLVISSPRSFAGEEIPAPAHILAGIEAHAAGPAVQRRPGAAVRAAAAIAAAASPVTPAHPVSFAARLQLEAPPEPREFIVDPFPLSASSLDAYCECARKFFYTKVLRIPQEKTIYLTIGSLFHEVMETLCRENTTREGLITALSEERITEIVDAAIADSRELAVAGELITSLTRHHLGGMLRRVRAIEKGRPGAVGIGAPEEKVEFTYGQAQLVGRIDRVDEVEGAVTVLIDYKASKSVYKRGSTIKSYLLGEKGAREKRYWQVPIYSFSVRDRTGNLPAAFCYYAVPVDKDAYVAGLSIGEHDPRDIAALMGAGKLQFESVSEGELRAVMDEVSTIAGEIFTDMSRYEKTDDTSACKDCEFNRVCERYE